MSIFLICSVVCQFHIVFQKLFGKFEPIIRFCSKADNFSLRSCFEATSALLASRYSSSESALSKYAVISFSILESKREISAFAESTKSVLDWISDDWSFCFLQSSKKANRVAKKLFYFLLNLRSDELLADIFLSTRIFPFGTAEIVMTFLCFGGNEATTFSATEKSSVQKWLQPFRVRFRFPHHHFLNGIKSFFVIIGSCFPSKISPLYLIRPV